MNDPTSLSASQNLSRVRLTWSAPTGATYYLVYRKDEDVGTDLIYLAKTTDTEFIDYGVPRTTPDLDAINYEYTVKATDGTNTSSGATVSVACSELAHSDVGAIGLGHPRYKIGSTSYSANLTAISYGTTVNASTTDLNDSCALTLAKSLSRL